MWLHVDDWIESEDERVGVIEDSEVGGSVDMAPWRVVEDHSC